MSDVFISYAHVDNPELDAETRGWVSQLHVTLTKLLSFHLGRNAKVWRDPRLDGNDAFEDVILRALTEAETLVSVISPRYVQSKWCVREVVEFCQRRKPAGGIMVGDKSRLLKLLTLPMKVPESIAGEPVPAELKELFTRQVGTEFFERDPESGRTRVLREEFGPEYRARFFQKVDDVACMLATVLQAAAQPAAPRSGRTVYLAHTCHDLQNERDRLERELRAQGHEVLPDAPLPVVLEPLETAVTEALKRSHLAVHLVGKGYGLVPENTTESIVEIQNRLAAERASDPLFRRLIWAPRGDLPKDPRLATFLERLGRDAAAQRGAEFAQGTIDELKDLLFELVSPPKPAVPAPSGKPAPRVYLICEPEDEPHTGPVEDYLFNQGLEVSRPMFEGSAAEVAEAHRFNLRQCDAALIYYGRPSRHWVDVKLQDLAQAPGYGRTSPLRATAICVAPPDNRDKQRFRTHQAAVLHLGESFSPTPLQPFVEQLLKAGN